MSIVDGDNVVRPSVLFGTYCPNPRPTLLAFPGFGKGLRNRVQSG
jgi:hypothetical protein